MNAAEAVAFETARILRSDLSQAVRGAMGLGELAAQFDLPFDDVCTATRLLMGELFRFAGVRACAKCGCTEEEACEGGCSWVSAPYVNVRGDIVGENLCSACAPKRRRKAARR